MTGAPYLLTGCVVAVGWVAGAGWVIGAGAGWVIGAGAGVGCAICLLRSWLLKRNSGTGLANIPRGIGVGAGVGCGAGAGAGAGCGATGAAGV